MRPARPDEIKTIYGLAYKMDLDSQDMDYEDFTVIEDKGYIVAFGRLKKRGDAIELGTLGVVEKYRGKGLAKKIVGDLLSKTDRDVYLTTLIPAFFEKFGFKELSTPPPQSLIRTKEFCEGCGKVGCTLMKLER